MVNYKNRGSYLEKVINISNKQYLERGLALIHKIPTPTRVNPKKRTAAFSEKSTVDFTGVSLGTFVAFDTKETKSQHFPFSRLEPHQISYLKQAHEQQGQSFILILFSQDNELYRLDIEEYTQLQQTLNRKSIPIKWFRDNKQPIKSKNGVYYDYLDITDNHKGGV
ncbi:Holliday junction resolvase RecU [Staphylococcus sp. LKG3-3]|uniref:Holliday junction resolvase RecU n=1 Tax=Staphylococcus sp. LKG3-3 TaxID=3399685 RepID=UPI003D442C4D